MAHPLETASSRRLKSEEIDGVSRPRLHSFLRGMEPISLQTSEMSEKCRGSCGTTNASTLKGGRGSELWLIGDDPDRVHGSEAARRFTPQWLS